MLLLKIMLDKNLENANVKLFNLLSIKLNNDFYTYII